MCAAVMRLFGPDPRVVSSDLSMSFSDRAPNGALVGCLVIADSALPWHLRAVAISSRIRSMPTSAGENW
jgi:hypothetical protein